MLFGKLSWGIMMIQENIPAPCTVLDFPTLDAFERELTENSYDVVGISSIIVNVGRCGRCAASYGACLRSPPSW